MSKGNTFADNTAKEQTTYVFTLEEDKQPLTATFLKDMQMHSSKTEKLTWKKHNIKKKDRLYISPTGKPVLPKNVFKWAAIVSHGPCHVSTGGMVALVQSQYYAIGFQSYSKNFANDLH